MRCSYTANWIGSGNKTPECKYPPLDQLRCQTRRQAKLKVGFGAINRTLPIILLISLWMVTAHLSGQVLHLESLPYPLCSVFILSIIELESEHFQLSWEDSSTKYLPRVSASSELPEYSIWLSWKFLAVVFFFLSSHHPHLSFAEGGLRSILTKLFLTGQLYQTGWNYNLFS